MTSNGQSRTIAVILARAGSSRLPGKVISEVGGIPLIAHLIGRVRAAAAVDAVVLATPDSPDNSKLQEVGLSAGARIFAGSSEDVLDRLYQAGRHHDADIVIHIGGDCPFADPNLVGRVVQLLHETAADFVCNILPQTFPSGMDVEAITIQSLEAIWRQATLRTTRKHPFAYIHQNRDQFHIENLLHTPDLAHLRWTLDYQEDLDFVRAVYEELYPRNPLFGMDDILALLQRRPKLGAINKGLSAFSEGQPAFWDSEGYLADVRADLLDVLKDGILADRDSRYGDAENRYRIGRGLLDELHQRAKALGGLRGE